jgi:hypothetical protein
MKSKRLIGLTVGAVLVLVVVWGASAQGIQILLNERAEDGNMANWTYDANFAAVTSSGGEAGGTALPHWGSYFFGAAAQPASTSSMSQNVDVSGKYFYCAGGFIQTEWYPYPSPPASPPENHDHGEMIVTFYDGASYVAHHATGAIGNPVYPLGGESSYAPFEICAFIPPLADNATYQLDAHKIPQGSFSNVYYDDLYFEVWELVLALGPASDENVLGEDHVVCLDLDTDEPDAPVAGLPITFGGWRDPSGPMSWNSPVVWSYADGIACYMYTTDMPGMDEIYAWIDWNEDGLHQDGEQYAGPVFKYWEAEFVPEWGSVALLGSGLMGMAGYATLRLRKK